MTRLASRPAARCYDCGAATALPLAARLARGWRREAISAYLIHRPWVDRCQACVVRRVNAEGARIDAALTAAETADAARDVRPAGSEAA